MSYEVWELSCIMLGAGERCTLLHGIFEFEFALALLQASCSRLYLIPHTSYLIPHTSVHGFVRRMNEYRAGPIISFLRPF